MDTRTEKAIQDAMQMVMCNRTSIVIAHRLSTIRDSDLIVVMDHGQIVESGNHNALLAKKGRYYELYMTQYAGIATLCRALTECYITRSKIKDFSFQNAIKPHAGGLF